MENVPRVGVAAILRKNNKVLLASRLGNHGEGTWGFPGGKLEYRESIRDCVMREVFEETSLKVKNIKFGALTNDIFESGKHFITIFMICDWKNGEPRIMESKKMGKWEWFDWGKMPKPLFLPIVNLLKQNYNPFKQ